MAAVLDIVFSSFWTWLGTIILLGMTIRGILGLAAIVLNRNVNIG